MKLIVKKLMNEIVIVKIIESDNKLMKICLTHLNFCFFLLEKKEETLIRIAHEKFIN